MIVNLKFVLRYEKMDIFQANLIRREGLKAMGLQLLFMIIGLHVWI